LETILFSKKKVVQTSHNEYSIYGMKPSRPQLLQYIVICFSSDRNTEIVRFWNPNPAFNLYINLHALSS